MAGDFDPGRFNVFEYVGFEMTDVDEGARWSFRYRLRGGAGGDDSVETVEFTEVVLLPPVDTSGTAPEVELGLARLLFLAAGLSYYKTAAPAVVRVPGGLTPQERLFIRCLIGNGLAEYAYVNDLPEALNPLIEAPTTPVAHEAIGTAPEHAGGLSAGEAATGFAGAGYRVLVPVGGGKDSIVTVQTVRSVVDDVTCFSVGTHAAIDATARTAGLPLARAQRHLSPRLIDVNRRGALNGHVPVTAVTSLIAVLHAQRAGLDAVVMSNERSASVGNTRWRGVDVNHQWSKSYDAEVLLRDSLRAAGSTVEYFSLLRPLSELAILAAFAEHPQYFPVFRSCNRVFRLDPARRVQRWCGDCPKCRFIFLGLAPFVTRDQLVGIMGRDLLDDPSQWQGFAELLGVSGHKPLECVGEVAECRWAWSSVRGDPAWKGAALLEDVRFKLDDELNADLDPAVVADLFEASPEHCLPEPFQRAVRSLVARLTDEAVR